MPAVSIITPSYNAARFVGRMIDSVRAQTIVDWEHIIVDDGSTDGSAAIVEGLAQQEPRIRLVRKANGGVASARNAGFRAASTKSEYLLFLDADDAIEPKMLEVMSAYMDSHPGVGMLHCGHLLIDSEDKVLAERQAHIGNLPRYVPARFGVRALLEGEPETPFISVYCVAGIIPSICLLRRSVYEKTPGWDEAFGQHYEDTDLFLQMAIQSKVHFLPERLVRHRRHPGQNTADPRRFGNQEAKLYAKWTNMPGLTPEQRATVEAAERFRTGRLVPYLGLKAGMRHLRSGEIKQAARFLGGAARRYAASFLARGAARPPVAQMPGPVDSGAASR